MNYNNGSIRFVILRKESILFKHYSRIYTRFSKFKKKKHFGIRLYVIYDILVKHN